MKIIGLTGGIATGKNAVAAMLAEMGAVVIDADQLARDAVAPGTRAYQQIVECFWPQVLSADGALDRQALRELVFCDPQRRQQLESLVHPAIKELALQRFADERQRGTQVLVYMAPLLIEAGAVDRVDEVWVVTLRSEVQLERLLARDGCSRELSQQMIAAQMPLTEKECYGVVVIDNSADLATTRKQVESAWQRRIAV